MGEWRGVSVTSRGPHLHRSDSGVYANETRVGHHVSLTAQPISKHDPRGRNRCINHSQHTFQT